MTEQSRPERHTIVVDCEMNGLDHRIHEAVECAWWNLDTSERGVFIPRHNVSKVLKHAQIEALQINRYVDRLADQPQDTGEAAVTLWEQLSGRTAEWRAQRSPFPFVQVLEAHVARQRGEEPPPGPPDPVPATMLGSNPRIDALMLEKVFRRVGRAPDPMHHRLLDISAYAMGVLGLDYCPGLFDLCERLGVEPGDHSAEADVTATGVAYLKLRGIVAERRSQEVAAG